MKALLAVTAVIEAATGLALLGLPLLAVAFLLGAPIDSPGGLMVTRVAGAALLALGIACWPGRSDSPSHTARRLVVAVLVYDAVVVMLLIYASLGLGLSGIGLWPAVGLHTAMAVWCATCLRPPNQSG